jgi:hypothetical protein
LIGGNDSRCLIASCLPITGSRQQTSNLIACPITLIIVGDLGKYRLSASVIMSLGARNGYPRQGPFQFFAA